MPLHDDPCIWPQSACTCRPDCGACDGAGFTSNIGCCGNGLPSGECCGNGVEVQDPCEHCQTTGKEPIAAACIYCAVGHPQLRKPDGVFHDIAVDEGFHLHACTNSNPT